jgi:hypothetical protein
MVVIGELLENVLRHRSRVRPDRSVAVKGKSLSGCLTFEVSAANLLRPKKDDGMSLVRFGLVLLKFNSYTVNLSNAVGCSQSCMIRSGSCLSITLA